MKRQVIIFVTVLAIAAWNVVLHARVSDSTKRLAASEQKYKELKEWTEQYRWIPSTGIALSFPEELKVHTVWIYKDVIMISPISGLGGKEEHHGYLLSSIASRIITLKTKLAGLNQMVHTPLRFQMERLRISQLF